MKEIYEKPVAKLTEFEVGDRIMYSGQDPNFSEGVVEWPDE